MSLARTLTAIGCGLSLAVSLALVPPGATAASPSATAYMQPSGLAGKGITPLGGITGSPKPSTRPSPAPSSGGKGASIESMTLQPSNTYTSYHYYEADNDGPPYCGLHTNGTGPEQTSPGEILAGYFRYWDPGTQPFPCWEQLDQVYRGAVKFDFTPWFHDLIEPSKFLITAKLRFDVSFEDASTGWPTGCPSPVDILQAGTDWTSGTPDLVPGDQLYNLSITDQHTNELDVSMPVRRWLAYNDAGDNGFVFADLADESYPQQNVTCLAHVHNLSLVLQYLPLH
jgi:hypothetical protein